MKRLTIAILNWNGAEMLKRFLPSVLAYSQIPDVEICVIDNASTDGSCDMLANDFPDVRIIRLAENYGFSEGYNRGLQQVDAEYVLLLNSDVEVTEGWLLPLLQYMDANPEIAACQPKIRSQRNKEYFEYAGASGGFIDCYGYPFCRGRIFDTVEKDEGQYDDIVPVFWATGAALMVRQAIYNKVGGLDARFFAHMEEIDFCWRLRSRGYGIVCIPQSQVYHVGAATLRKENPRKTYLNFRNNLLMLYKNLSEKELKRVMRIRFFLDYTASLVFLLKGDFSNARAVWRARRDYREMRKSYFSHRQNNLKNTTVASIRERVSFSLLWRSKFKGRVRYSDL